jgi:hypothetical protein
VTSKPASLLFQSAKLGDIPQILDEVRWAQRLLDEPGAVGRVYGVSGGGLVAFGLAMQLSSRREPERYGRAQSALEDLAVFLCRARSRDIRRFNVNPAFGAFNLRPLRRWLEARLRTYAGRADTRLMDLPVALYLCAGDRDATFTLFGPPDASLQFEYGWVRVGPPHDAPIIDALTAALSTALSTEPAQVNGAWYRDCRPAIPDGRAIVADLEAADPRPIRCRTPHTPMPSWKLNWITSSFLMHRAHERNQSILARLYADLLARQRTLELRIEQLESIPGEGRTGSVWAHPAIFHIDLPYIGSTEATTNMRQSVAQKDDLMDRFRGLLEGQFDRVAFDRRMNVIYGAGGFSGILAGLVTTRQVEAGFARGGGQIAQIYGVSAGVLNGFFHAVQVAAARYPDLYTPAANHALADLEDFFSRVEPRKIARVNLNPHEFWEGWASLSPLEGFLLERLAAYTGSQHPEQITFDDIALPLTVAAARDDGLTDLLGMTDPERKMRLGGVTLSVLRAPVVRAMIAGWSMNTYVRPTVLGDQRYRDGGCSFYDPGLLVACLDAELIDLLNIHLDEPDGHSYNLPPRPTLLRLLFDTHNYNFPEERRRMRRLTDLLFEHDRLRSRYHAARVGAPPSIRADFPPAEDFRQTWDLDPAA